MQTKIDNPKFIEDSFIPAFEDFRLTTEYEYAAEFLDGDVQLTYIEENGKLVFKLDITKHMLDSSDVIILSKLIKKAGLFIYNLENKYEEFVKDFYVDLIIKNKYFEHSDGADYYYYNSNIYDFTIDELEDVINENEEEMNKGDDI